jgi:hypothetical protein
MFGKTAPVEKIVNKSRVTIGTDSTMSGSLCLLDEMRAAGRTYKATPGEIMNMVTKNAAAIFGLPVPEIKVGQPADCFVVKASGDDYVENLMNTTPSDIELVMVNGNVRLLNSSIDNSFGRSMKNEIKIGAKLTRTDVDVASLKKRIAKCVPGEILEKNPLWTLIQV